MKKAGISGNILVFWDVSLYEFGQEVVVASLVLSLKYPLHDPGDGRLPSSPGGVGGGGWLRLRLWYWL